MKRTFFILFMLSALIGCEEIADLKLTEIIPGGCALENKGAPSKGFFDPDTVIYTVRDDSLSLMVGFNATCCSEYSTSAQVKPDSILVKINTSRPGMCNCICYYTYNFKFTGTGENFEYKITIDNILKFAGRIKQKG